MKWNPYLLLNRGIRELVHMKAPIRDIVCLQKLKLCIANFFIYVTSFQMQQPNHLQYSCCYVYFQSVSAFFKTVTISSNYCETVVSCQIIMEPFSKLNAELLDVIRIIKKDFNQVEAARLTFFC